MHYFAYGSNLSTRRLRQRVTSAQLVTKGTLQGHQLRFHKIGRDGTAKCNAFYTGCEGDVLYGAVYNIDPKQRVHLDQAEGLGKGYEIKRTAVIVNDDQHLEAFTYYATRINADILPFHWYREHVLTGAREHNFPDHYIEKILAIRVMENDDQQRADKELAIYKPEYTHP